MEPPECNNLLRRHRYFVDYDIIIIIITIEYLITPITMVNNVLYIIRIP